jgi:chromate transporter
VIYRSLEGINAAVVGIMIAATFFIAKDIALFDGRKAGAINLMIIGGAFLLMRYTRLPSPVIVGLCLLLGYFV